MATVDEYKDEILAAVAAEPALAGLSDSQVAEWLALVNVFSSASCTMEELWAAYSAELDLRGQQINVGTLKWYADKALEFQYGDPLVIINGKTAYETIDVEKRIIKLVAAVEQNGYVVLKVAKADGVKLTNDEAIAFAVYLKQIKIAGAKTAVVSVDPDLAWLVLTVYYVGTLPPNDVKTAVETAVNNYLSGIYFNGIFNVNLLRNAIEKLSEVVEGGVNITSVKIKPATGAYTNVVMNYQAVSGRYAIDPEHALSATITYIAS